MLRDRAGRVYCCSAFQSNPKTYKAKSSLMHLTLKTTIADENEQHKIYKTAVHLQSRPKSNNDFRLAGTFFLFLAFISAKRLSFYSSMLQDNNSNNHACTKYGCSTPCNIIFIYRPKRRSFVMAHRFFEFAAISKKTKNGRSFENIGFYLLLITYEHQKKQITCIRVEAGQ